jgi:hypothetical protein
VRVEIDSVVELGGPFAAEGTVTAGGIATVKGWSLDEALHRPVEELTIAIGDGPPVRAILGFARDDVAARFSAPEAGRCGFVAVVPVDVPVGLQPLRITVTANGESIRTADEYGVDVVPAFDAFEGLHQRSDGWLFGLEGVLLDGGQPAVQDGDDWILERGAAGRIVVWALDIEAGLPARDVIACAGGTFYRTFPGIETPAVAAATGVPGAERAGFSIPVMAPLVGSEAIRLYALAADGRAYGELCTVRVRLRDALPLDALPCRGKALGEVDRVETGGERISAFGPVDVARGEALVLSGWAVDAHGPRPAALVELHIAGAGRVDAEYGLRRLDVAHALKCGVVDCGFAVRVDTAWLEPGTYRATLRVLAARRDAYTELRHVDFTVL